MQLFGFRNTFFENTIKCAQVSCKFCIAFLNFAALIVINFGAGALGCGVSMKIKYG